MPEGLFRPLCHVQGVVHFNAKVAHRALELGMTPEKPNSSKVLGPSIKQSRLSVFIVCSFGLQQAVCRQI
jgi:hypothetical protein